MTEENKKQKKVKKWEVIVLLLVIVLGCLIVIPMVSSYWKEAKLSYHLGWANKQQILGVDDSAFHNYETALKIDPKNVDAYIGMAEIYSNSEFGNYDMAKEILQKAKKVIRDEEDLLRIEEKEKEIDELIRKDAEDKKIFSKKMIPEQQIRDKKRGY